MRYPCDKSFIQFTHKFFVCTESFGSNGTADYKLQGKEEFEVSQLKVRLITQQHICFQINEIVVIEAMTNIIITYV